jgi:hypothetical protein
MEINFKLELLPQLVFMLKLYLISLHTNRTMSLLRPVTFISTIRLIFSKLLVHSAYSSLFNETPVYTDIPSFVSHRCSSSRNNHHSSAVRTMTPYKLAIIWECIKVLNRRFDLVSSFLPIHHILTVSHVRQAHRSI